MRSSSCSILFGLPKINKPNLSLRPIVSSKRSPTNILTLLIWRRRTFFVDKANQVIRLNSKIYIKNGKNFPTMGSDFQVDEWLEETLKMLEDSDSIPGIIVDKGVFNTLEDVMTRSSRNSSINQCHIDGCCFRDGKRRIDMVLAYTDKSVTDEMHLQRRSVFESELQKQGLELELEDCVDSFDGKTYYLKIHAPWNFLLTQAEAVELKMPLKQKEDRPKTAGKSKTTSTNILKNKAPQKKNPYTAIFSLSKLEQFDIRDEDSFFSQTQRHFLVWHVLSKALYDENVSHRAGIRLLLAKETYIAAFPLHDGPYEIDSDSDESEASCSGLNERQILQEEWSRPGAFFKTQPYENIRRYFGDETGLYFSWLGFYTMMLVPASVAGLIAFLYGAFTLDSDSNVTSKEICGNEKDLTMCPLCDQVCPYWKLGDSCLFSKISYTFDNPATVVFAVFMSFWATILLELWKRRQAKIRWEWDLLYPQQLEDEEVRPEYEKSANGTRISPITGEEEPYVKPSSKNLRYFLSITGVLLIGAALVMAMLGVIIYRITIVIVFFKTEEGFVKQYAKLLTSITASLISLVVIQLLNWIGKMLAKYLTDLEAHRTQAEYDEKYTIKIWFFEFINDYSLLIYIALFKGRFYTYPGDPATKADIVSRLRTDQCDPAGCLSEIFIQLAIIMVGKQLLNNFLEILLPFIQNSWKLKRAKNSEMQKENAKGLPQWEKDLLLKPASRDMLQSEYLELAAQYGFVTLFVAAFPLAPLFALINCIIEIRVDAFKLVAQFRRPVPIRIADMGIWQEVIKSLTYLAVIVNAFVIAYTSEFIPRIVYYYTNDFDNDGYIRSTLSLFSTSDFTDEDRPSIDIDNRNFTECYYRGLRNPPSSEDAYKPAPMYWIIFAVRLCFVLVFEHLVFGITSLISIIIPDIPVEIKDSIKCEMHMAREAMNKAGKSCSNLNILNLSNKEALSSSNGSHNQKKK